jgi:hypothetical protein
MPICPVCHLSTDQVIDQPNTSTLTPSISPPTDLNGLYSAMRQLIQGYDMLRGQAGQQGPAGKAGQNAKKPKTGRFQELTAQRITRKVKVFSKQDPTTFVEFKQINGMTFKDTVTGELWKWTRGSDQ